MVAGDEERVLSGIQCVEEGGQECIQGIEQGGGGRVDSAVTHLVREKILEECECMLLGDGPKRLPCRLHGAFGNVEPQMLAPDSARQVRREGALFSKRRNIAERDGGTVAAVGGDGGPTSRGGEELGREGVGEGGRGIHPDLQVVDLPENILFVKRLVRLGVREGAEVTTDHFGTVYPRQQTGLPGSALREAVYVERCVKGTDEVRSGGVWGERLAPALAVGKVVADPSRMLGEGIYRTGGTESDAV